MGLTPSQLTTLKECNHSCNNSFWVYQTASYLMTDKEGNHDGVITLQM